MQTHSNILADIQNRLPRLPRTLRHIGENFLRDPDRFANMSMREMAVELSVSEPSIVRFSREFGYKGLVGLRLGIVRAVGANTAGTAPMPEPVLAEKANANVRQKEEIAVAARHLVDGSNAIVLDSGSTVQAFAKKLGNASPLTILTTGLGTLLSLSEFRQHKLMLPGGTFRPSAMSLSGRMVEDVLSTMTFDVAFIGADSISINFGLATYSEDEGHLTKAIVNSAKKAVVLADSEKFQVPRLHKICDLEQIDTFVSDDGLPRNIQDALEERGCTVIISGKDSRDL